MHRPWFRVAACLASGAVTTVAAAWACSLAVAPGYAGVTAGTAADVHWIRNHLDDRSGAAIGYGIAIGYYLVWAWRGGIDFEGAFATGIAFVYGPALALVLGWYGVRLAGRRGR